jgi:hypothetical protein
MGHMKKRGGSYKQVSAEGSENVSARKASRLKLSKIIVFCIDSIVA